MGKRTIDQWTWDYWLVQRYVNLCYRIFYRKIYVNNVHNIPRNQPVIIAPNHQNALMDALAFVCNTPFQSVFLARSDIFKGKFLVHILNFLNIMPIYRIRDGIENVRKNEEIFDKTLSVLRNKFNPLIMFPEGNHGEKRRLRPLVKGIFRIAFIGQEDYREKPGVKIVPVGLDYASHSNFRSTIFINFGKPVEVCEYYPQSTGDKVTAMNELRDRLSSEISKLIINIRNEGYYSMYMHLRTIYNRSMRTLLGIKGDSLLDRFRADRKMIEILDRQFEDNKDALKVLNEHVSAYNRNLKINNLRDWIVEKNHFSASSEITKRIALYLLSPLYLIGLINNFIPYKIPERFVRKIRDRQFHSSIKFGLGMVLFPLYYVLAGILAGIFIPGPVYTWMYIVLMPLTGFFAYNYYIWSIKNKAKLSFLSGFRKKSRNSILLVKEREEIVKIMDHIAGKYLT